MGEFETLEAGDTTARLYVAGDFGSGAGVVVLHPWWGLNDDVIAYADRLVAEGYAVVAPDMFSGQVATAIEDADRLSSGMDEEVGKAITLAAVDLLAERIGPERRSRRSGSRSAPPGRSGRRHSAISSSPPSSTTARGSGRSSATRRLRSSGTSRRRTRTRPRRP
jgi:hypothetical protein